MAPMSEARDDELRQDRRFEGMTVPEMLELAEKHIESAKKHLALAKRHREEFDRLERLRGVPLFRRRW